MSDADKTKQGVNPLRPFYIAFDIWLDKTIDADQQVGQPTADLDRAIEEAVASIEENGGVLYVVECRAVRKIVRGKTRVIPIQAGRR